MTLKEAVTAKWVRARTTGYGRLTKGEVYKVVHNATPACKCVFIADDTGCIHGYNLRNFENYQYYDL